jgi:hypothetical protein
MRIRDFSVNLNEMKTAIKVAILTLTVQEPVLLTLAQNLFEFFRYCQGNKLQPHLTAEAKVEINWADGPKL